ncbi:neural proliferation differentiation and control protein 1a [Mugil cephalus]|uniref:neural proliferation differentiation and control protein 1a n=1 Tax=Mugil cephalus TaxID=48193 RepID=UPI001FB728AD|nr:neural proliferation differentiation and control protein 1a [Mugil cephalus]
MLLLSSPRCGRQRRASPLPLLLLAALLLCVDPVSASLPAHRRCPHPADCNKQGRDHCRSGSTHCGPCFSHLQENDEGRCVKPHQKGRVTPYASPEEEIDLIQSLIEKQQKQSPFFAAITPQTNASKPSQRNQDRLSDGAGRNATQIPSTPTPQPRATGADGRGGVISGPAPKTDSIFVIVISVCVAVGTVAVILATICYVKLQKESRLAEKVDYPAYGGAGVPPATGNGTSMGDKTLAQSAQMYHYQHQKQQMLSMGNHKPEQKVTDSEVTSDEEEVGGDFTVYECPGLAPTGEMEVKNPLFDDSTIHYETNPK